MQKSIDSCLFNKIKLERFKNPKSHTCFKLQAESQIFLSTDAQKKLNNHQEIEQKEKIESLAKICLSTQVRNFHDKTEIKIG